MLGENIDNKELSELFCCVGDNCQNEDSLFEETVDYYQNGIEAIEVQEWFYEVHGDRIPQTQRN